MQKDLKELVLLGVFRSLGRKVVVNSAVTPIFFICDCDIYIVSVF